MAGKPCRAQVSVVDGEHVRPVRAIEIRAASQEVANTNRGVLAAGNESDRRKIQ
jgi:hypothetical protein